MINSKLPDNCSRTALFWIEYLSNIGDMSCKFHVKELFNWRFGNEK